MKDIIQQCLNDALNTLKKDSVLPADINPNIQVTRSKDDKHGDFATNLALMLAKAAQKNPRDLAQQLCQAMPDNAQIVKTEIAGPGFINFFLQKTASHTVIDTILEQGEAFGRSQIGNGQRVMVEFVSANPTGPLHVGHGRGAAFGEALADLLGAAGYAVDREYYVNDAGRQMDILAVSVWLRYLEQTGIAVPFPTNGYKGEYVRDIANNLPLPSRQDLYQRDAEHILQGLPQDECDGGDKEAYIDALIARCRELLGENIYQAIFDHALNCVLDDIKHDLHEFGVDFETWFSEKSLTNSGELQQSIDRLKEKNYLYEKNGALWFRSTDFNDEKDRVVQRDNGVTTYFASDIAYYLNKLNRGYERIICVWGADHHGYIARLKAAAKALTGDDSKLEILLVQFAILYRGQQRVQMSTRTGEFVTLRELRDEVGCDAARFFYIMRRSDQHMDFDLELAKSKTNENPVYYVQYAHARIASVLRQLEQSEYDYDAANGRQQLSLLSEAHEIKLIKALSHYPEVIEQAALNEQPHQITYYLRDLANDFHSYYNAHKFILEQADLRNARLTLIKATQQVLANALHLIGVSAPDKM